MKLKHDLGPDQEGNPARKKSVSVAKSFPRSCCFVESLLTIRTHQPNSGRDADKASDTFIENIR